MLERPTDSHGVAKELHALLREKLNAIPLAPGWMQCSAGADLDWVITHGAAKLPLSAPQYKVSAKFFVRMLIFYLGQFGSLFA
mgnify:CR=1 FL=1